MKKSEKQRSIDSLFHDQNANSAFETIRKKSLALMALNEQIAPLINLNAETFLISNVTNAVMTLEVANSATGFKFQRQHSEIMRKIKQVSPDVQDIRVVVNPALAVSCYEALKRQEQEEKRKNRETVTESTLSVFAADQLRKVAETAPESTKRILLRLASLANKQKI